MHNIKGGLPDYLHEAEPTLRGVRYGCPGGRGWEGMVLALPPQAKVAIMMVTVFISEHVTYSIQVVLDVAKHEHLDCFRWITFIPMKLWTKKTIPES